MVAAGSADNFFLWLNYVAKDVAKSIVAFTLNI